MSHSTKLTNFRPVSAQTSAIYGQETFVSRGEERGSAVWTNCFFLTAIGCNAPSKPDNGFFRPRKDDYDVGAKVSFNCREGYILKGAKDIFCKRGGDWNDDEPICERKWQSLAPVIIHWLFQTCIIFVQRCYNSYQLKQRFSGSKAGILK